MSALLINNSITARYRCIVQSMEGEEGAFLGGNGPKNAGNNPVVFRPIRYFVSGSM